MVVPLTAVNVLFHFGWAAGGQSGPQRSNGAHVQITVHYSYFKLLYKSISGRQERTVLLRAKGGTRAKSQLQPRHRANSIVRNIRVRPQNTYYKTVM